jgi:hypothetical protein
MDVVRHVTIGPDLDAEAAAGFPEPGAIESIVAPLEEDARPPVAALRDVMRQPRNDGAGGGGHEQRPSAGAT